MQNILARLTRTKKLIIGIALLIIAAALLYFTEIKKATEPPPIGANTNSVTTIDTSNWKTYSEPALGIEFKYPQEWNGGASMVGPDPGNERVFWRDTEGRVYINSVTANLYIVVKKSSSSLEEFWQQSGFALTKESKQSTVAGWPAIINELPFRYVGAASPDVAWQTHQIILAKAGDRFVMMDFGAASSDEEKSKRAILEWEKVLETLKIDSEK